MTDVKTTQENIASSLVLPDTYLTV